MKQGSKWNGEEMSQKYIKGEIETVSINSVHMNKNWSLLTAKLKTCTGNNKLTVPYKIDTGSDGNKMPWYIFKKLFPRISGAEREKTMKNT